MPLNLLYGASQIFKMLLKLHYYGLIWSYFLRGLLRCWILSPICSGIYWGMRKLDCLLRIMLRCFIEGWKMILRDLRKYSCLVDNSLKKLFCLASSWRPILSKFLINVVAVNGYLIKTNTSSSSNKYNTIKSPKNTPNTIPITQHNTNWRNNKKSSKTAAS